MADPLGAMASILTLLDVCAKIVEYIHQVKDDSSERIRLMMEIFSIKGILESLSATVKGAEAAPGLWSETIRSINRKGGPLDLLQEVLIAFHDELGQVASAKGLERMGESDFWPFKKKKVEKRLRVIDSQKLLLTLALDNDHAALSIQSDARAISGDATISAGDNEASSEYCYSTLSEQGSIRLLRLMPHEDEKAIIQCQLFEYPLQKVGEGTTLYEALSYVWGFEDNRRPIYIQSDDKGDNYPTTQMKRGFDVRSCLPTGNNRRLLVTANLHTALLHLRDRFVERILWIDAICIHQGNKDEKGQQVQLMARIYAKANRVIVWLGEAPDNNNQALEVIRKAAEEQSTSVAIDEVNEQAILTLLEQPWFQRIWVLQEVAAARHVLIMYGPTAIDGYAFCSGLSGLNLSYKTSPDFQGLILPAVYLIRGAGFRPRYKISLSSRFSLNIRPLGELVDMYHTHKAANRLDKVYALLGMSSDNPSKEGLSANYNASWGEVFRKLIKFSLFNQKSDQMSNQMSVTTCDNMEVAVIEVKGYIFGEVSSVGRDNTRDDRQRVDMTWKNMSSDFEPKRIQSPHFTLQASAKPVQVGDVVCLLQGASKPTIVRLCSDFPTIIRIVAPPTDDLQRWLTSVTTFPDDLLLVWDWHEGRGELQGDEDSQYLMNNREVPKCPRTECQCQDYLEKSARLWNFGLLLNGLERYEDAGKNLRNAVKFYMTGAALRSVDNTYPDHGPWRKTDEEALRVLDDLLSAAIGANYPKYGQIPLFWAAEEGHDVVVRQLLDKGANIEAKDIYGQKPLLCAARNGHEAVMQLLLDKGVDIEAKDKYSRTPLSWAAGNGHEAVMQLLLDKGADKETKDDCSQTLLLWAAKNGHKAVMQLLLNIGADIEAKDKDGQTSLSWAAKNGHDVIVQLLLATRKVDVNLKDNFRRTPLAWAAENGHGAVMQLLLNESANMEIKDREGLTLLLIAAKNGHEAVIQLLLNIGANIEARDVYKRTPLSWAARNGHRAVVQLLLDRGASIKGVDDHERTPLSWAARNGHEAVIKLLLAAKKVNIDLKDYNGQTPLSLAAENGHEAIMQLLLNKGADIETKDRFSQTLLWLAASNGHKPIVQLLLATKNIDINSRDSSLGRTPLLIAAENNHEAVFQLLLDTGANIYIRNNYGWTLLILAARGGNRAIVQLLLNKGFYVEAGLNDCGTPLSWAAKYGHEAVVQLLLDKSANIEAKDRHGRTPLLWAAENGYEAILQLLLNKSANIEAKDNRYGRTSLSWAAQNGHEAVFQLLLNKGADIEAKDDSDGQTPLLWATRKGHEAIVQLLLNKGADIEAKEDFESQTPLSLAARFGHEAIIQLLLNKGANIEANWDSFGQTPLWWAAEYGNEAVIQLLLNKGADIEGKGSFKTPLSRAAEKGHKAIVQLLLNKGADIEGKGTPLSGAAKHGHKAIVQLLLNKGADTRKRCYYRQTPLLWAVKNGHEAVRELLASHSA